MLERRAAPTTRARSPRGGEGAAADQAAVQIIAVGLNYIDHCKRPVCGADEPVLFSKFTTSICGPYDDLSWPPSVTKEVDYEVGWPS
jgi:2-keto-4-pentenoate hydratase/2-oxohepta-3-ene-1,7-dioic acid hydratase in catechol pathway